MTKEIPVAFLTTQRQEKIRFWGNLLHAIIFHIFMSFFDFITDILAGLELFNVVNPLLDSGHNSDIHVIWGSLNFVIMVIPGLMVAMQVLYLYIIKRKATRQPVQIPSEHQEQFKMLPSDDILIQIDPDDEVPNEFQILPFRYNEESRVEISKSDIVEINESERIFLDFFLNH